jgi:hypothetical protein
MNTKMLLDFGKQVLIVAVGVGVYNTVITYVNKAKTTEPSSKQ